MNWSSWRKAIRSASPTRGSSLPMTKPVSSFAFPRTSLRLSRMVFQGFRLKVAVGSTLIFAEISLLIYTKQWNPTQKRQKGG
jgi:hypothetical protein